MGWQKIGLVFDDLISKGYFPGIGYDKQRWEAWVFMDEPIEGLLGRHIKRTGTTPTEAITNLVGALDH